MQISHNLHTADSLLQDHLNEADQVLRLSRSPGYWIHFNSCKALADIYKDALQKLTTLLALEASQHSNAHELQVLLQPSLAMLLAAIRHGKLFLQSCTPSLPNLLPRSYSVNTQRRQPSASSQSGFGSVSSDTSIEYSSADESFSRLHKALILGLASDVADVHLHDLLIAFCAVAAAIDVYKNKQYRDTETRMYRPQITRSFDPSPDLFWKEQNKPRVLLVSGTLLDNVKQQDELFLTNPQLTKPMRHSSSGTLTMQQQQTSTPMEAESAHYTESVANLVAVMEEMVKCSKQAFEESISPSVFLNIKDLEKGANIYTHDGANATVLKASWLGKEFALKMYKKQAEAFFLQEASVHIRLHHPNVINAIALFQGEKKCGILMELMDGTLKNFWQTHRDHIKLQDKVKIMLQIANGMEYVHRRGLIHRDLKTSNVLVSSSMDISASASPQIHVKIADFGTAKPRPPNSSSFYTKKIGTHVFRAPEVLNDDIGSPSYRRSADVYSFAMTCFELLAVEEPFHNHPASARELFQKIREGERPDLASISDAACPPYLKHCLTNWWDGNPDTRHSFAHICCILRHLYACLASCQSEEAATQQFLFLAWPMWQWKCVQDIVQQKMQQLNDRRGREDWQLKGYVCKFTRVNEIPYEMHVMDCAIKEVINAAIPHEVAEASNAHSQPASVQPAGRSFGQKLKEFCCFSAPIGPSTHEAFHDQLPRRN